MLTRTIFCIALAGSAGCLRPAEPVVAVEAVELAPDVDRAAELEEQLAEAREQLALREASLERASVMQAALDRRIEELTQLNEEVIARLRTAAMSAQVAAERACLTPMAPVSTEGEAVASVEGEAVASEIALREAPSAAPTEAEESLDESADESVELSSPREAREELASTLDTD